MAKLLEEAKRDVCRLIGAAEKQDIIEKGAAGVAFWDDLSELWRLRDVREEEWASAVNFLQSALANGHFEAFSVSQCKTLQLIVSNYITAGLMRQDDVRRVKLMLRGADLDPWKAISFCEGDEE